VFTLHFSEQEIQVGTNDVIIPLLSVFI